MFPSCKATIFALEVIGSRGESAICSATNHSGEMKGETAPAMLFLLIRRSKPVVSVIELTVILAPIP